MPEVKDFNEKLPPELEGKRFPVHKRRFTQNPKVLRIRKTSAEIAIGTGLPELIKEAALPKPEQGRERAR